MRFGYFIVEGPHDQEFVGRLLKIELGKMQRIRQEEDLDARWKVLIPRTFPHDGDLLKRMPVPTFFQNQEWSIAIQNAIGDTKLAAALADDLTSLDAPPEFVGVFLDADKDAPQNRFNALQRELTQRGFTLPTLQASGQVCKQAHYEDENQTQAKLRLGIFVLPDNQSIGTLENILLECAANNYPTLHQAAQAYVQNIDLSGLNSDDLQDIRKPTGRLKATVSCVSNILRPGKSVQVSIQDNRWIDKQTETLPKIQACLCFVRELLSCTPPSENVIGV
ncbi:hypothetical protein L6R29_01805 [Myxococcota bacterium]|nr:hypothetical protein [Myxococcota bacterium]